MFDAFLKLQGIEGESQNSKHKGEIEVLSFSWGISSPGSLANGGGGGAGKVTVHEFSITKMIDASSPILFHKVCQGSSIGDGLFTLVDRQTGLGFYKIKFEGVIISSVQPGANTGHSVPTESMSLNFTSVEISAADARGNVTE